MKQFKRNKNLDNIIKTAQDNSWEVDTFEYDQGSDWIWIRDMFNRMLQIKYNIINGHFYIFAPISDKPIATHMSEEFDNQQWYNEILDMIYEEAV